jgi:PAS domain S-box-containing protein
MQNLHRILIVEDHQADAELIKLNLEKADLNAEIQIISTKKDLLQVLENDPPDLVISDYNMHDFTGENVLEMVRERFPDLPFILVTGYLGEKKAVEIMTSGANDYVMKDELDRLGLAAKREIKNFEQQKTAKNRLEAAYSLAKIGHWEYNVLTDELYWSKEVKQIHGVSENYKPTVEKALTFSKEGHYREYISQIFEKALKNGEAYEVEVQLVTHFGEKRWVRTNGKPEFLNGTCVRVYGSIQDVTERKKAELALQKSESTLKDIFEHSTNLFYRHDTNHKLTYVSPQSGHFLGHPPDKALRSWTDYLTDHPFNRLGIEYTKRAIETGQAQPSYTLELKRPDGNVLWVRVNEAPVLENGKTIAIVGSLTDITELEDKRQRLENAQRIGKIGDWDYDLKTGEITWSDTLYEIYERNPALGPPDFEHVVNYYPDKGDFFLKSVQRAVELAIPYSYDIKTCTESGNIKYVHLEGIPTVNKEGDVVQLHGIVQDVTERKQIEQELHNNQERLKDAQRIGKIGDWDYDLKTGEVTWSDMLYEIYERDPSLGPPSVDEQKKQYPDEKEKFLKSLQRAVEEAVPYSFDIKMLTEKNNEKYVHLEGIPITDENGEVEKLLGIAHDITERKLNELEIRHKQRQIESISNNINGLFLRYVLKEDGTDLLEYVSSGVENVHEVSEEEALENVHKIWEQTLPIHEERMRESIMKSAENLTPWREEWQIRTPRGKLKWLKSLGIPHKRTNGDIVWDTYTQDVTDWFKAERELKETLQLSEAILETLPGHFFMIDKDQKLFQWNQNAEKYYAFCSIDLEQKKLEELFDRTEKNKISSFIKNLRNSNHEHIEIEHTIDSKTHTFYLTGKELETEKDSYVILTAIDISERKEAERQNETLVQEVHHRVKNNLAIITGLLELQLAELNEKKHDRLPLQRAITRIHSIAEVHKLLHEDSNLVDIEVAPYFKNLFKKVVETMEGGKNVKYIIETHHLLMNVNELTPLGMLINELLTNTMKYGMNKKNNGEIYFSIDKVGQIYSVKYQDNGPGVNKDIFENSEGAGFRIVKLLLHQLEADYTLNMNKGFGIQFSFKEKIRGAYSNLK